MSNKIQIALIKQYARVNRMSLNKAASIWIAQFATKTRNISYYEFNGLQIDREMLDILIHEVN